MRRAATTYGGEAPSIKINKNQYEFNLENKKLTPQAGIKKKENWNYISLDELNIR